MKFFICIKEMRDLKKKKITPKQTLLVVSLLRVRLIVHTYIKLPTIA